MSERDTAPETPEEDIMPFLDAIEAIAFSMAAPNPYTPQIVSAVIAIRNMEIRRRYQQHSTSEASDA